jgi:DHA2 family multidrug resistance protein-like MFS transporter
MSGGQTAAKPGNPPGGRARAADEFEDGLPWPRRLWAALTVLIAITMSVLDSSIANVALPTIAESLKASPSSAVWVVNAYQLALMMALLPLASLGDIHGYKRINLIGLAVFTLASLGCAVSASLPMLAAMRAAQGVGAAGLMSVNAALIRSIYPRAMLGRALGINAFVVATSAAAGPSVAAAILSVASWPWLFLVNLPLGLIAFSLAPRVLPPNRRAPHRFDGLSALLNALTFGLLITCIDGFGHGESYGLIGIQFVLMLVSGTLFAFRLKLSPFPMLPIDLFARPVFTLSVATSVCSFIAQSLALVSLPFYFEHDLGLSQVTTGLLITPWPLAIAVVAPISGHYSDRYPAGILGGIGLAALSLGLVLLAFLPAHPGYADVAWRMTVCGVGFGIFQSPNNRAIIAAAPRERSGGAGAIISTARLLGQTSGTALVALVFGLAEAQPGSPGGSESVAILMGAGFSAVASLVSCLRLMNFDDPGKASGPNPTR